MVITDENCEEIALQLIAEPSKQSIEDMIVELFTNPCPEFRDLIHAAKEGLLSAFSGNLVGGTIRFVIHLLFRKPQRPAYYEYITDAKELLEENRDLDDSGVSYFWMFLDLNAVSRQLRKARRLAIEAGHHKEAHLIVLLRGLLAQRAGAYTHAVVYMRPLVRVAEARIMDVQEMLRKKVASQALSRKEMKDVAISVAESLSLIPDVKALVYNHQQHTKRCVCALEAYIGRGLPGDLKDQVSKIEKLVTDLVEQHNLEEKIEQTRSFIAFCQYNPDKNKPAKETWILARVNGFEKWVTTLPVYARLNEKNKERIAEAFKRCRVFIQRHPRLERRMLISSDKPASASTQVRF
jgi:hypothetical protein